MKDLQFNNIQQFLAETGLNWSVEKQGLQTVETGIKVPKHIAVVRSDNQEILSVMGHAYQPYQNDELLELLFRITQRTEFEIARAGIFNGGGKVYFQMKSEHLTLGNDLVQGYVTAINSFDGTTSLGFGASNVTISCQNTFFSAFRQLDNKARHTKNLVQKVDLICKQLETVKAEEARIFGDIELLTRSDFDETTKEMVIRKLFAIKKDTDINDDEAIIARTRRKIDTFKVDLRSELDSKGDNMWGLFSGVTKYTTHSIQKNEKKPYDPNSKMFNFYGKREQAIFHELVNLSSIGVR